MLNYNIKYMDDYLKLQKADYAYEAFKRRSYIIKCNCISCGTYFTQKKYLNLYKDLNKYAELKNTKLFYFLVIKLSNKSSKLAFFFVYIYSILKCIFRRIKYTDYISK